MSKETFLTLIHKYTQTGDISKALHHCNVAINIHPENADLIIIKVRLLIMLNQIEEATHEIAELRRLDIQSPEVIFYLGFCYYKSGNYSLALQVLEEAKILATLQPMILDKVYKLLGEIFLKLGKPGILMKLAREIQNSFYHEELKSASKFLEAKFNIWKGRKSLAMQNLLDGFKSKREDKECLRLLRGLYPCSTQQSRTYRLNVRFQIPGSKSKNVFSSDYEVVANSLTQAFSYIKLFEKCSAAEHLIIHKVKIDEFTFSNSTSTQLPARHGIYKVSSYREVKNSGHTSTVPRSKITLTPRRSVKRAITKTF